MQEVKPIEWGRYVSYWFYHTPRRLLHCLSYYKFAAKMIGTQKRVLDIGCNEGIGTYLIAKECGFAKGIDFDKQAIEQAQENFNETCVAFEIGDFLQISPQPKWDAIVNFDVIEHIFPEHVDQFMQRICSNLKEEGVAIIGTPSYISQQFASDISKKGHVNIYDPIRLKKELSNYFHYVFLFAANDEVVHTGFLPLAHYLIAVCCKKRS